MLSGVNQATSFFWELEGLTGRVHRGPRKNSALEHFPLWPENFELYQEDPSP